MTIPADPKLAIALAAAAAAEREQNLVNARLLTAGQQFREALQRQRDEREETR